MSEAVQIDDSQIIIDGGGKRKVTNFETGAAMYPVVRNWTLTNTTVIGGTFLAGMFTVPMGGRRS